MFKKILVLGVALIMCLGLFAGCSSGIKFSIGYNNEGGFGSKGQIDFSVTKLVRSLDELKDLCEEWSNPAFQESSELYSNELSKKIRSYDEVFFSDKAVIVYSSFDGQIGRTIEVKNIRVEDVKIVVNTYLAPKRGAFEDVAVTWLLLIEVNKVDVKNITSIQITK